MSQASYLEIGYRWQTLELPILGGLPTTAIELLPRMRTYVRVPQVSNSGVLSEEPLIVCGLISARY